MERRGGVEDGAVRLCRHHGARAALAVGRHLAAVGGQHPQLEGVHLHPGAGTCRGFRLLPLSGSSRAFSSPSEALAAFVRR